jgi:hypothetical protein
MSRQTKRPSDRHCSAPHAERPAGIQTISAAMWASIQQAIRQLEPRHN